jgi:hypothetical protein
MEGFKDFFAHHERGYSDAEVISLYLGNMDKKLTEISVITQKSIGEIYRILHNNNVTPNRLKTNHQNVVDFAASGMTIEQVAELTGYSTRNVRYILSRLEENGRIRN